MTPSFKSNAYLQLQVQSPAPQEEAPRISNPGRKRKAQIEREATTQAILDRFESQDDVKSAEFMNFVNNASQKTMSDMKEILQAANETRKKEREEDKQFLIAQRESTINGIKSVLSDFMKDHV